MSKIISASHSASLTEAQRKLLSEAVQRPDGGLKRPSRVRSKAVDVMAEALLGSRLGREIRTKAELPVWQQDEEGRRISLVLTRAGRQAAAETGMPHAELPTLAAAASAPPRTGSKLDEVVTMLRRDGGSNISALMAATGWLPHTTRAALTGLRKRGFAVSRQAAPDGSGSVYRITEAEAA